MSCRRGREGGREGGCIYTFLQWRREDIFFVILLWLEMGGKGEREEAREGEGGKRQEERMKGCIDANREKGACVRHALAFSLSRRHFVSMCSDVSCCLFLSGSVDFFWSVKRGTRGSG